MAESLFDLIRNSLTPHPASPAGKLLRASSTGGPASVGFGYGAGSYTPSSPPPALAPPAPPELGGPEPDRSTMGPSTIGNVPSFSQALQKGIAQKLGGVAAPPARTENTPGAIAPKPSMRAIRLPNGTVLFTNRDEYGGDEFTGGTAAGGREVRMHDRLTPTRQVMLNAVRPSMSDMPGALVNASHDQALTTGEAGQTGPPAMEPTHHVAGRAFDQRPGVSMIEGTPEQQRQIALQDMEDAIALEQGGQQLEVAKMPPGEAAALGNPTIQSGNWLTEKVGPELDKAVALGQAKIRLINTPGTPGYIADPRLRQVETARIEEETRQKRQNLIDMMSAITRQTIQPF